MTLDDPDCSKVMYANGQRCSCVKAGGECIFKTGSAGNDVYELKPLSGQAAPHALIYKTVAGQAWLYIAIMSTATTINQLALSTGILG